MTDRDSVEEQRKVINQSYAVIRNKSIESSLRTLLKLVEKKTKPTEKES